VVDIEHLHDAGLFVNAVDDAVSPTHRAVTTSQRAKERFAYPAWAQGERSLTELKNSRRYRLRQPFSDGAASGRLEPDLIGLTVHVPL
jgi:hypothetical protein